MARDKITTKREGKRERERERGGKERERGILWLSGRETVVTKRV